jgi:hypothetical protein
VVERGAEEHDLDVLTSEEKSTREMSAGTMKGSNLKTPSGDFALPAAGAGELFLFSFI